MDITTAAADSRAALEELITAAEAAESRWTTPREPGKWSPAQVTEHVAITFEQAASMMSGEAHGFPSVPFFVKPIARTFVLNRTIKSGTFPSAKTFKAFDPPAGPESPAAARARLMAAHDRYIAACTACDERDGLIESSVFGRVPSEDYMRFMTLHTLHHRKQIPTA